MRKIILGAIVVAAAASAGSATAQPLPAPLNGCTVTGGAYGATEQGACTYTTSGATTSLLISTPNSVRLSWTIHQEITDEFGNTNCVATGTGVAYNAGSANPQQGLQSAGAIPAADCAGPNEVTLTVGPDSAGFGVEGWIGTVTVFEHPA